MRRFLLTILITALTAFLIPCSKASAAPRLQEISSEKKVVIVIDPGHGGENLGTTQNHHLEKEMTLTTALAMYEELSLYDNVEVYLTRTEDIDLSLKKRAQSAESVEADFLFSIHYNASEYHEMYGSEVWVSAFEPYNGYGYQFGYEILTDLRETGLLIRGVKTRLASTGEDYYGIIRESAELGVPAVIIEHCHVDEEHDTGFCDDEEKLKTFGRMDATAAARYFGLKSSALHVDYSEYSLAETDGKTQVKAAANDRTKPDVCRIELLSAEKGEDGSAKLSLQVSAADYDSSLLYYSFSLDGGRTFSGREPWPGSDALTCSYQNTFTLDLDIAPNTEPKIVVRAYNPYDLYTESNPYTYLGMAAQDGAAGYETHSDGTASLAEENQTADGGIRILRMDALLKYEGMGEAEGAELQKQREKNDRFLNTPAFAPVFAGGVLIVLTILQGAACHSRRKRRTQWRNEEGNSSDQPI